MPGEQTKNEKEVSKIPVPRSYFNILTPEAIKERAIDAISALNGKRRSFVLKRHLKLAESAGVEEIAGAVEKHIDEYRERILEISESLPEYLKRIRNWLDQQDIRPQQDPENIPLYIIDAVLGMSISDPDFKARGMTGDTFNWKTNAVYVNAGTQAHKIPHEYAHAMAYDRDTGNCGFCNVESSSRNPWLDEGAATLIESVSCTVDDTETRSTEDSYIKGFLWLLRAYAAEVKSPEDEIIRAFLCGGEYRKRLEEKTHKRFGCSIEELGCLYLGEDERAKEQMLDIMHGKDVILIIDGWEIKDGSLKRDEYEKIVKIFPNVKIEIQ